VAGWSALGLRKWAGLLASSGRPGGSATFEPSDAFAFFVGEDPFGDGIVDALGSRLADRAAGLCVQAAPAFGSVVGARALFFRLGHDRHFDVAGEARGSVHLGDTAPAMVANRRTAPGSKRAVITEWLDEVASPADVSVAAREQGAIGWSVYEVSTTSTTAWPSLRPPLA